ncbi:hypothetical protein G647_07380 [Cladophialophora carrionii CBS 160.54]|uniref:Uncharacterized protein n=1 Tax=Cladophialophora carrionii CBS 160.54 TaxID=1279043 RepID=V9D4V6_9EURO|nr:uncharacterized protein G647_07380 [Cladophialophora carrionii CBS 160.54]ETI21037.1 hypothetical protein G647_07380 [Cladophialophora carrionii CBS 160.54]
MSHQSVGPAQPKDRPKGEAHGTPNGVSTVDGVDGSAGGSARRSVGAGDGTAGTEHPNADTNAAHFGLFHDEIEEQVGKLQDGWAVIDGAVGNLYLTFGKYGQIVTTVGERYGKEGVLEEKNQSLQAANEVLWERIRENQDKHEKEKSDLCAGYETKLKALAAQAKAGEEEKKRYEDLVELHEEQNARARQKIETKLQQRMKQLETEHAAKIAGLESDKENLLLDKANLTRVLEERTRERDEEKETRETMQTKLRGDVTKLEKDLADMKAKYRVKTRPSEY